MAGQKQKKTGKARIREIDQEILSLFGKWSSMRDNIPCYPLILPHTDIQDGTVDGVYNDLRKILKGRLDVFVDSGGGQIDPAYNMALSNTWNELVFQREINMSERNELNIRLASFLLFEEGELSIRDIEALPFVTSYEMAQSIAQALVKRYNARLEQRRIDTGSITQWEDFVYLEGSSELRHKPQDTQRKLSHKEFDEFLQKVSRALPEQRARETSRS